MPGLRHAHTLQQLQVQLHVLLLGYVIVSWWFCIVLVFCCYLLLFGVWMLIKYSPGGEYSLTFFSCCSVWAWRKPGIKKSWSLSSENYILVASSLLPSRSLHHHSFLSRTCFLFRTAQSFLWLDPRK